MMDIVYLGKLSDVTGLLQESLTAPENIKTTSDLRNWLDTRLNANGALCDPTIRIAINSEIVQEPSGLQPDDEIAFMPPVGGG